MTTPNLELPEWAQAQAQPHATVNQALRILDCLTQLLIQDRDLSTPPAGSSAPLDGECFIVSGSGTGDWTGFDDGDIAMLIGTDWIARTPKIGWKAYVIDEGVDVRFDGSSSWDIV